MQQPRKKVYIAGPLAAPTVSGRISNVNRAKLVAAKLIGLGYAPLCPHLTHYLDTEGSVPHNICMDVDLPWVKVADAVLRLPGPSPGADMETNHAKENGIPVYLSALDLVKEMPP